MTTITTASDIASPNSLEDHIRRDACPLSIKIAVFLVSQQPTFGRIPDWWLGLRGEYDREEAYSLALHHWFCFMALMEEPYAHGPRSQRSMLWRRSDADWLFPLLDDDLDAITSLPASSREQFRSSLSSEQLRSWEVLRDCWDGVNREPALSAAARLLICTYPDFETDEVRAALQTYNDHMVYFYHWRKEFYWKTWDSVLLGANSVYWDLQASRKNTCMFNLTNKYGLMVLQSLRAGPTVKLLSDISNDLPTLEEFHRPQWLPSTREKGARTIADDLPMFVWDLTLRRTRRVSDLLDEKLPVLYTCISHTWGRWKKAPSVQAQVQGVDWAIPENTLFEVSKLPDIISRAPVNTRFVWFDLVCLPQDISSPEYALEVGRQATIFRNACECIVWMSQASCLDTTQAMVQWLALNTLREFATGDIDGIEILQRGLARAVEQTGVELAINPWLSSTWTLQEASLCPAAILCDREWRPLQIIPGTIIRLSQLIDLFYSNNYACNRHIQRRQFQYPEQQLYSVLIAIKGSEDCRCALLDIGAKRACSGRRAEAIMSALDFTHWYNEYLDKHQIPPPDEDLVLGSYTLPFVREAADKMGAEFFMSVCVLQDGGNAYPSGPPFCGTFLPFGTPENKLRFEMHGTVYESQDHIDVKSWTIRADGSVHIPRASVLASSDEYPQDLLQQVSGRTEHDTSDIARKMPPPPNARSEILRLWKILNDDARRQREIWMDLYPELPYSVAGRRLAIVLGSWRSPSPLEISSYTVLAILESLTWGETGKTSWIRFLTHTVHAVFEIPASQELDLTVL